LPPTSLGAVAAVRLVPITEAAYQAWLARLIPEYATDLQRAGHGTADEALERARRQTADLLPAGRSTPGQYIWTITDSAGDPAGVLWVAVEASRRERAFIYDIEVDPSRRGQGLGTAALGALEGWARAHAITAIGLHVFGDNEGARRLYRRLGYIETSVQMEKRL
jgi:ribosomal protein S18 acetylase RimI-like enzyme